MRDLEASGHYCYRSAGSHSMIDVTALGPNYVLLVQCKTGGVISSTDKEALRVRALESGARAAVASREGRKIHYEYL